MLGDHDWSAVRRFFAQHARRFTDMLTEGVVERC